MAWSLFYDYQKAAAQIAKDYHAVWIPYQKVSDNALKLHLLLVIGVLMASIPLELSDG